MREIRNGDAMTGGMATTASPFTGSAQVTLPCLQSVRVLATAPSPERQVRGSLTMGRARYKHVFEDTIAPLRASSNPRDDKSCSTMCSSESGMLACPAVPSISHSIFRSVTRYRTFSAMQGDEYSGMREGVSTIRRDVCPDSSLSVFSGAGGCHPVFDIACQLECGWIQMGQPMLSAHRDMEMDDQTARNYDTANIAE
ncbi:hypothetical protein NMY22_g15947 [Coprinellus aureogranulatus]|nr:hypothetical protein NMY22_g15947 [Coprinellus aureogranulatus]